MGRASKRTIASRRSWLLRRKIERPKLERLENVPLKSEKQEQQNYIPPPLPPKRFVKAPVRYSNSNPILCIKPIPKLVFCMICSSDLEKDKTRKYKTKNTRPPRRQIELESFLLDDLLAISKDMFKIKYPELQPLASSIFLCLKCTAMVQKAKDVSIEIKNLSIKMSSLKAQILKEIRRANIRDVHVGTADEFCQLARDIRRNTCLYPGPSTKDISSGGMYLSSSIWTSSTVDDRSNFGQLRTPEGLTEPEIFFLPSSQVRKHHLFQNDPLNENSLVSDNNLMENNEELDEIKPTFSIQTYCEQDSDDSDGAHNNIEIETPVKTCIQPGPTENQRESANSPFTSGSSKHITIQKTQPRNLKNIQAIKIKKSARRWLHKTSEGTGVISNSDGIERSPLENKKLSQLQSYTCEICDIKCNNLVDFTRHRNSIHQEPSTSLKYDTSKDCGTPIPMDDMESYEKDQPGTTAACTNKVSTVLPVASFKCSVCQKCFSDGKTLMSHFTADHNKNVKVKCYICSMIFNTIEECETHVTRAHPKENFPSDKKELMRPSHKLDDHSAGETNSSSKYKCRKCYMHFNTSEKLLNHEKSHDNNRVGTDLDTTEEEHLKFACPEPDCNRKFALKNHLSIHLVQTHKRPKPTNECEFCSRSFSNSNALKRHRMVHTGEKPEVCDICSVAYRSKGALIIHKRSKHTNERPFGCNVCSKTFFSSTKLKRHLEIHSDERPYLCTQCGKQFKSHNNLYIHMWSHDPDRKTKYSLYMPKVKKTNAKVLKNKNLKISKPIVAAANRTGEDVRTDPEFISTLLDVVVVPRNEDLVASSTAEQTQSLKPTDLDNQGRLEFNSSHDGPMTIPDALMESSNDKIVFLSL